MLSQNLDSRQAFIETLGDLAEKDDRIILFTCDVGFSYLEKFQGRFPDRFFNLGVTEQSSMMVAVGMAREGYKVYIYSMINFVLFRPYEMVRNGVCHHNADVKLVGVRGSEKYKFLGFSHNIAHDEDLKVLKHLPNMNTYTPEDNEEVEQFMRLEYERSGPAYFRL